MVLDAALALVRVLLQVAVALLGFAVAYLLARFALVALVGWATGEDGGVASRHGPAAAKGVAFLDALLVVGSVFGVDLRVVALAVLGGTLVFCLAALTYGFERRFGARAEAS